MSEAATLSDVSIRLYQNSFDKTGATSNLDAVMDGIKSGKWRNQVEQVRNEADTKKRNALKQRLPAFTPSGVFSERKSSGLQSHSGRLAIDFDLQDNPELETSLEAVRENLQKDKYSECVSSSVSGQGLFVIVKIDGDQHAESFEFLQAYYQENYELCIDKSCKDVSRLRFVSYDPKLHYNENAETVIVPDAEDFGESTQEDLKAYPSGQSNNKSIMEAIIKSGKMIGDDGHPDWTKVGFVLAHEFGEAGRSYFHALSQRSSKYDEAECDRKYDNCLRTNRGDVTFATIIYMAKAAGIELPQTRRQEKFEGAGKTKKKNKEIVGFGDFWVALENGDVELCTVKLFQEFLPSMGFKRYRVNPEDTAYMYVRISDSIVDQIQPVQMKDFILAYLNEEIGREGCKNRKEILKKVLRKVQSSSAYLFSEWQINSLPYITIDFLRDTFDTCYLFFNNGFVEIKKDSEILHPYTKLQEMKKFIWRKSIKSHAFKVIETPSVFADFVVNTSSYVLTEEERAAETAKGEQHTPNGERWMRMSDFESKITALGYMLHGYKNVSNCLVVIGCDAQISEKGASEGGTGKSIFLVQALSQIKNLLQMDGQGVDLSDRFCFQQVTPDTEVIAFDDASWKFNFRALFQRSTGNFSVERKNARKFEIPFAVSPKMTITSNHTLKGEGHSFTRRQHIIEFSDYYKLQTPKEVHGKVFFTAWDKEEWNAFFCFVIYCIQKYLGEGVITPKIRNYETRKLLDSTPDGFSEWAESAIALNTEHKFEDLFSSYKDTTGDTETKSSTFTSYVKKWVNHNGLSYNPHKNGKRDFRNGKSYVKIVKNG
ncbi:MAG: PriCT-2 domain-containing protein [Candidatus Jettenia sp.]|nr:MAG: PriCT-2 domain-containing protein [Candidatus Jettenia sp.]